MGDTTDVAHRIATFDIFLSDHPFTEHHLANLTAHITYGTADPDRMARFAGAFAAAAVRYYWETPKSASVTPALLFLERQFIAGNETVNKAIAAGINDALHDRPLPLREHFNTENLFPEICTHAMQCCLSLGVFKEDRLVNQWLDIPERMGMFADNTGVWLFDGNSLSAAQVHSLESIFSIIPRAMLGVTALFVPEAISYSAATVPLRLPGIALDIPVVPMEMLRNFSEIPPYVAQPPIPEFTAQVLEQVMRAIITTTLPKRPDLIQRAAAVMRMAVALPDLPLAQLAPPKILMGTPDVFLAYLGVLWLANAEALLEAAVMLAETGTPEPLYVILLAADFFSMQGDTTLLFHTLSTGTLITSETALRRAFLSPVIAYVNGIALGGHLCQYDMTTVATLN